MNVLFSKKKGIIAFGLVIALLFGLIAGSLAYFSDKATESATGTAGTVNIELNSMINLLDANGYNIINPGDRRDASFEVVNLGNKSIDVKTEIVLEVASNFNHDLILAGDSVTQSQYDLYYASDVELVEGKGWMPKDGAVPVAEKVIAADGKSITYTLPVYSLNGNSVEHTEFETIDGIDAFSKTEDIVMLMDGQANNLWQNSTVSIAVKVYAKQHENTGAGWDLVGFDAEDSTEGGEGSLVINTLTTYNTRVGGIELNLSKVVDSAAQATSVEDGNMDVVEVGTYTTSKNGGLNISDLEAGTYIVSVNSAPYGYDVEDNVTVLVTENNTTTKNISVSAASDSAGTITYNTTDVEGNGISGVGVSVESEYEYGQIATDANGAASLTGVVSGANYTITAPDSVDGQPILTDAVVTLQSGSSETGIYGEKPDGTTSVYASLIGDTLYLATYPIHEQDGVEASYVSEDISLGGKAVSISKGQVNKVVVVDEVKPVSTAFWFADYTNLSEIENFSNINFSNVVSTASMFKSCFSLNAVDLTNADFSKNTNMSEMFYNCYALNSIGDASSWNLSNVTTLTRLFSDCSALSNIGNISNWNVSKVTDMSNTFARTGLVDLGDLSGWDVSNVTSFQALFGWSNSLSNVGKLSGWVTSKATDMSSMFSNTALTELDLTNWNTANVKNMSSMFSGNSNLTSVGDISGWNTGKVTSMSLMFFNTNNLGNVDLSGWNVSKVEDFINMFNSTGMTSVGDLSNWNTSSATSFVDMFAYSAITNIGDISGWNISNVESMGGMFAGVNMSIGDLNSWNVANVKAMLRMFENATITEGIPSWYDISIQDKAADPSLSTIKFIVVDEFGNPIRAEVQFNSNNKTTDEATGETVFVNIENGEYEYYVYGGYWDDTLGLWVDYETKSGFIAVTEKNDYELNITLRRQEPVNITVVDESGNPLAGVWVFSYDENGNDINTGVTDGEGKAGYNVYPGSVKFVASLDGYADSTKTVEVVFQGGTDVELVMKPVVTVPATFTVQDANGNPVANASLTVGEKYSGTTDENGQTTIYAPTGTHSVTGSGEWIVVESATVTIVEGGENNFTVNGYECGSLYVNTFEANCVIKVVDENDTVFYEGSTDESGFWAPENSAPVGTYTITWQSGETEIVKTAEVTKGGTTFVEP